MRTVMIMVNLEHLVPGAVDKWKIQCPLTAWKMTVGIFHHGNGGADRPVVEVIGLLMYWCYVVQDMLSMYFGQSLLDPRRARQALGCSALQRMHSQMSYFTSVTRRSAPHGMCPTTGYLPVTRSTVVMAWRAPGECTKNGDRSQSPGVRLLIEILAPSTPSYTHSTTGFVSHSSRLHHYLPRYLRKCEWGFDCTLSWCGFVILKPFAWRFSRFRPLSCLRRCCPKYMTCVSGEAKLVASVTFRGGARI